MHSHEWAFGTLLVASVLVGCGTVSIDLNTVETAGF
jgi:hypothetical protein